MEFMRVPKEVVIVIKSPMPYGHDGLYHGDCQMEPLNKAVYLHLEAQIFH
jgi:hypothetical protein